MIGSGKTKKRPKTPKRVTKRQTKRKPLKTKKQKKTRLRKAIKNEVKNIGKPKTKLEKKNLVDYLNNLDYNPDKDLKLQLAIHLAKQSTANKKAKTKKMLNNLNLEKFLKLEEAKRKEIKREEELKKMENENKFANELNVNLIKYGSMAKPIKLRLDRNPRVYFINGHSIACPSQPIDLKLFSRFSSFQDYKLLQMQSLGRMNSSYVTILLAKLLESNPELYEYFISLETDGDVEKFKKLFAQYAFSSLENNFLKYKKWAIQFKTKYIADFEIYPKPKNPDLQQVPYRKTYSFYSNDVMSNYPMGIYEVTRLNPLTGRFEMEPFLFSEELHELFLPQKVRAKKSGSMLEIIKVGLLIPDKLTEKTILKFGGKEYLEKINKLNQINRHYFQSQILKSTKLDLREERAPMRYVLTQILYNVEETTPDNEILVLDNSCNSFPVLEKNKKKVNKKNYFGMILNQSKNPELSNNFKEEIKKFKPKRSKSRENESNNL